MCFFLHASILNCVYVCKRYLQLQWDQVNVQDMPVFIDSFTGIVARKTHFGYSEQKVCIICSYYLGLSQKVVGGTIPRLV